MLALLKKDYLTNRFVFLVSLLIGGIIIILLSTKTAEGSITLGVIGTMLIPMLANKASSSEDMRKNYDIIMNSFPVKRSDVVISRYIYYMVSYLLTAVVFLALTVVFNKLSGMDLKIFMFVESIIFLYYVLFMGISNVIYYLFPYEIVAKYANVIMMVIIYVPVIAVSIVAKVNPNLKEKCLDILSSGDSMYVKIALIVIAAGIVLYGLAILISVIGYKHKDLN